MTLYFHITEQMGLNQNHAYVSSSSPSGGTRGEICCPQLHLVDTTTDNGDNDTVTYLFNVERVGRRRYYYYYYKC